MSTRNRIHNSNNPYQGDFRKTLTVCSAGLLRSPTTAFVLSLPPYNRNVRAVGSYQDFALVPIDEALLSWADEIVFVNRDNFTQVNSVMDLNGKEVYVLNIPDNFAFRDPVLITAIKKELKVVGFPEHSPAGVRFFTPEEIANFRGCTQ
jgi:predicted protein tyrosine phosphatase